MISSSSNLGQPPLTQIVVFLAVAENCPLTHGLAQCARVGGLWAQKFFQRAVSTLKSGGPSFWGWPARRSPKPHGFGRSSTWCGSKRPSCARPAGLVCVRHALSTARRRLDLVLVKQLSRLACCPRRSSERRLVQPSLVKQNNKTLIVLPPCASRTTPPS